MSTETLDQKGNLLNALINRKTKSKNSRCENYGGCQTANYKLSLIFLSRR